MGHVFILYRARIRFQLVLKSDPVKNDRIINELHGQIKTCTLYIMILYLTYNSLYA